MTTSQRTGVDMGSPVNKRSDFSRETIREPMSTHVHPRHDAAEDAKRDQQARPAGTNPSRSRQTLAREGGALVNNNPSIPADLPSWIADNLAEVLTWGPAPVARGCFVPGCRRDAHLHGLCKTHHRRARRAWNPLPAERKAKHTSKGSASDSESNTNAHEGRTDEHQR